MISAADIREARAKAAESQVVFGQRFGVYQSTIHRWETSGPPQQKVFQEGLRRVLAEITNDKAPASDGAAA